MDSGISEHLIVPRNSPISRGVINSQSIEGIVVEARPLALGCAPTRASVIRSASLSLSSAAVGIIPLLRVNLAAPRRCAEGARHLPWRVLTLLPYIYIYIYSCLPPCGYTNSICAEERPPFILPSDTRRGDLMVIQGQERENLLYFSLFGIKASDGVYIRLCAGARPRTWWMTATCARVKLRRAKWLAGVYILGIFKGYLLYPLLLL